MDDIRRNELKEALDDFRARVSLRDKKLKESKDNRRILTEDADINNMAYNILSGLLNDKFESIANYNSIIASINDQEVIDILQEIVEEEYIHIGQLQKILLDKSPVENAEELVDQGAEEVEAPVEESLNEYFTVDKLKINDTEIFPGQTSEYNGKKYKVVKILGNKTKDGPVYKVQLDNGTETVNHYVNYYARNFKINESLTEAYESEAHGILKDLEGMELVKACKKFADSKKTDFKKIFENEILMSEGSHAGEFKPNPEKDIVYVLNNNNAVEKYLRGKKVKTMPLKSFASDLEYFLIGNKE